MVKNSIELGLPLMYLWMIKDLSNINFKTTFYIHFFAQCHFFPFQPMMTRLILECLPSLGWQWPLDTPLQTTNKKVRACVCVCACVCECVWEKENVDACPRWFWRWWCSNGHTFHSKGGIRVVNRELVDHVSNARTDSKK